MIPHPFSHPRVGPPIMTENLFLRSEEFTNTGAWVSAGGTITRTADNVLAPNETMTADRLAFDGGSYLISALSGVTDPARDYVVSFWARAAAPVTFNCYVGDGNDGDPIYSYDLAVGVPWYRHTLPFTQTSGSTAVAVLLGLSATGYFTGTIYLWGAQLSRGSRLSRYAKTLGAPV